MDTEKKARYAVGDEVTIISNGTHGVVKDITAILGDGDNIYIVDVMGIEKMCVEANLSMYRKKNMALGININDISVNFMIEDKINEIIHGLGLKKTKEDKDQLINACKLQAYLTVNNDYKDEIISVGNDVSKNQLFHGLFNGDSDPLINSYIFSTILRKVNMKVENVVFKMQGNGFYVANIVCIGREYYYFDVTLEKEIYKDNGSNPDNFVLCCAALGRGNYEQFFKPLSIIEFNKELESSYVPKNISVDDIDIDLVNKLLNMENR